MTQPRRPSSHPLFIVALGLGLCTYATPASAEPDEEEDLVIDDDDDDLDGDEGEEDPLDDEDDPLADDGDDGGGAEASAGASASLGGGKASADGKRKKKGKSTSDARLKRKKEREEIKKLPFFKRYAPTNHMLNVGGHLGVFWRANNHGLFDRGIGTQPSTNRTNFDVGFHVEYLPLRFVGVGLEGSFMPTSSSSEDAKATFFSVRGHVIGQLPYRLTPTLVMGGGGLGVRSAGSDILNSTDAAFHWGPGAKFYVNDWFAVRVDGRHLVTGSGNDGERTHHGELLFGAEVTIRLTRWIGADWRAKRADRDDDLVADYYDECPDEYGEDDNGCPLNRDSDHDGIADRRDKCPNEWGDGSDGCPVPDKDGDGILDINDSCEEQAENYNGYEDTDGCPDELPAELSQFEGVLEGIYFSSGKSKIRKKSRKMLDNVADVLSRYDFVKVEISGHTDDVGDHDKNMTLSGERAEAVKSYLVDKGIDESRITTRGAGPDEAIADNKTKAGRSKNRRIEFKIVN